MTHPFFMMFVKRILNLLIPFVTSLLCLTAVANPESYVFDDWICDKTKNRLCNGYYLEQSVPLPGQAQKNLENQPISITADQGAFATTGNSILTGHVHLIQGNRQAFADRLDIHRNPNKTNAFDSIQATGHVKITEPGLRIDGTRADIKIEQKNETIENANFRLYARHARGTADTITLQDRNRMILKNATYTTCSPYQNTWILKAENVDLNKQTGRGRARHARLYVKDIPIAYLPYMDFPIDDRRQTGFLYPNFGTSNLSGMELSTPYYWNLAPNYDATITPRYLSKRGLELQGIARYLTENSRGEVEGSILPNDRAYRAFKAKNEADLALLPATDPLLRDPRVTALNKGSNTREALRIKHTTLFNPNWAADLQYQTVRDDNYFMDFGNTLGMASTTQLLQQGDINYQDINWKIMTRLQQYQTLHPFKGPQAADVYRRLPQISLQNTYLDLPFGLEWNTSGEFSRYLHKHDPFTQAPYTTGDRMQLRPGLSLPILTPGWFIKPRIQCNMLAYSLSLGTVDQIRNHASGPVRIIPMYDLDSGLIFERNFSFQNEPYIQTLEPRAYYLYVPYHDQNRLPNFDTSYPGFDSNQLFRDNRFSGLDRVGDANHLTLSATTRFMSEETGGEKLTLTLGQIFYFQSRRVTANCNSGDFVCLNQAFPNPRIDPRVFNPQLLVRKNHSSALVGQARLYLQEQWSAIGEVEWNPYRNEADKESFSLQYQPDEASVFNAGYQFLRRNPAKFDPLTGFPEKLNQTDTSFAWAMTEQWRVLGRWHYDIKNHRSNDISFGIEQQGCCTAVRLLVTRFLEPYDDAKTTASTAGLFNQRQYSNAIFLQFIFKGFAGVGNNKMDAVLRQKIVGYRRQDEKY